MAIRLYERSGYAQVRRTDGGACRCVASRVLDWFLGHPGELAGGWGVGQVRDALKWALPIPQRGVLLMPMDAVAWPCELLRRPL